VADFGFVILTLATLACFFFTVAAAGAGFGAPRAGGAAPPGAPRVGNESLYQGARYGVYATTALSTVAAFVLVYSFLVHDFSLRYVAGYSGKAVPTFYLVLALWGGMEGSLLFWAWILSIFGAIVVWQNRARNRDLMPHVVFVVGVVQLFFLGVLLFSSNPFLEHAGGVIPADGRGLNPLLQTPAMAIHPPNLYLGFIGCTIPFAFALAALIMRRFDESWIKTTRRWAIAAWTFLTVGNLLGANWAYTELGWGGAWGWDPVENAAIMPWFPLTAYLHSVMIQERRGMLKVWNMFLIILAFVMTILGTFLTRSGVISSVHSFAQSDVGGYFLIFLGIVCAGSFGLLFARLRDLQSPNKIEAILSREFMFLLNNLVLLGAMLVILVGTLFPKLSELFLEQPVSIAAPWFNEVLAPVGLGLLLLMGVGPLMPWGRATPKVLVHQFVAPAGLGVAVGVVAAVLGAGAWGSLFFGTCVLVVAATLQDLYRATRVRMKNAAENVAEAIVKLVSRARRRYGGYIIHLGVVFIFCALTGLYFSAEEKFELKRGERVEFAGYHLEYQGLVSRLDDEALGSEHAMKRFERDDWHTVRHLAHVDLYEAGEKLATLLPGRFIYRTHPQQPTTEVDTYTTLLGDVYIVLQGFDDKGAVATFKVFKNPLMIWMWLGGSVMLLGAVICLWPDARRVRAAVRARSTAPAQTTLGGHAWLAWALGAALFAASLGAATTALASPRERRGEVSKNERVRQVARQLMCPCPTCNWAKVLATCGCGGAEEEIARIEKEVAAGRGNTEIVDARVKRFGWRVLAVPPDTAATRSAWLLPYVVIGVAAIALGWWGVRMGRRRRREARHATTPVASPGPATPGPSADAAKDRYDRALDEELRRWDR
jgi:cytochrome c-type biogenesis protein CcmF